MSNSLLRIYPSELKMPFEYMKQNSSCFELHNKTDQHVAFKVKTTNPRKYSVRPTSGVVPPRGSYGVTVTMQAPKEIPLDYHCKDRFLVQSIAVQDGTTQRDIAPEMFSKTPGRVVEEFKLRVVYIPANPPSPVPEEAEEEAASLDSEADYEVKRPSTIVAGVSGSGVDTMTEADKCADENEKLQHELELLRKRRQTGGYPALFALFVFVFSVLVGYFMTGRKA